jgi:hypothetical protein
MLENTLTTGSGCIGGGSTHQVKMRNINLEVNKDIEKKWRKIVDAKYKGNPKLAFKSFIEQELTKLEVEGYNKTRKKKKLTDYKFYGMWEGRKDMSNSIKWVRKIREEWNKRLTR